jgi:hypothetical protein
MKQTLAWSIPLLGVVVASSACWWIVQSRQEIVHNSLLDGSVWQVKRFLQHNWKDVGPKLPTGWGRVEKTLEGDFRVPCTFHLTVHGTPATMKALFTFDAQGQYVDVKTVAHPGGET